MRPPLHRECGANCEGAPLKERSARVKFARGSTTGNRRAMSEIRDPEDCTTMQDVRTGVDDIDRRIIALIARRFAFMDAAARIKGDRQAVRDERRKAEVIAKVKAAAAEHGVDPALVGRLYEDLIESSIAYEFDEFDRLRSG